MSLLLKVYDSTLESEENHSLLGDQGGAVPDGAGERHCGESDLAIMAGLLLDSTVALHAFNEIPHHLECLSLNGESKDLRFDRLLCRAGVDSATPECSGLEWLSVGPSLLEPLHLDDFGKHPLSSSFAF